MNRLDALFKKKQKNILSLFFTAGYPDLQSTAEIIRAAEEAGADMIEAGMPFSDPVADGKTIQHSSEEALKNGINMNLYFEQVREGGKSIQQPVLFMGYFNQVLQYGPEKFCHACNDAGIDGFIIPDLPPDIFIREYRDIFHGAGLRSVFLITPDTTEERIHQLDDLATGFLYMVSSRSITGSRESFDASQEEYFKRVSSMNLKNPLIAGFGISNHATFATACQYAAGAIAGSGYIKALEKSRDIRVTTREFVTSLLSPEHI
ncbi:MAG: tryptophan synthase subunit alpha [Bacteroidales bacterium]|nr:tryptophan synthase subunit alpha [Bacteroidales bacterium]